jgi:hypothetical protein
MKTTIYIKNTDLAIQLALYLLVCSGILLQGDANTTHCQLLATWQLFSCLLHGVSANHFYASVHRNRFHNLLLGTLLLCVALAFTHLLLVFILGVIAVPMLGMYYMIACFDELRILHRKSLVHLRK